MRWAAYLAALAACGRISFDDVTVVPIGHDEDGDGVPDASDVCPHLAGSQRDLDGDRVGDDCDPNPTVPRDSISLFATMMPGDQPFETVFTQSTFEQRADSLALAVLDVDGAHLEMPLVVGDARVAMGVDIVGRVDPATQNQFAIALTHALPFYYVELNESLTDTPEWHHAQITRWDGTMYFTAALSPLATVIHTGPVFFQTTQRVGTGVRFEVNWPGEPYVAELMDAVYQGGERLQVNINNLRVEIRWLVVITSS